MPDLTFTFSDAEIAALQKLVTRYNLNTGQVLTVQQWLDLTHKNLAISEGLSVAIADLQKQQEADSKAALEAAIKTARDDLLAAL